jgi:purine nucleosidase
MPPRKVIIDCDPGTDDAIALFLAFASPELEVSLVTVVGGNAGLDSTLPNARALVGLARPGVPVVAGADRPLIGRFIPEPRVHGDDGIGGVRLPAGPPATPGIAADAIREKLRAAAPGEITLVGIGPATNLGLVLATEPALSDRIAEIVLMTGAWAEGNATPAAEFNAWNDPEALAVVLACGRPVTLATLELTAQALCTPARLAALRARGGGACLSAACDIMASVPPSKRLGGAGIAQHDACAIMWLVAPALFTGRAVHATVDLGEGPGRGRTVIDRWGRLRQPANAHLLETLDSERFFNLLGERIATLP